MKFFGPILRFELARIARRQRLTLGRCAFTLVLAGIAGFVYYLAYREHRGPLPLRSLARVSEGLSLGLFGLLFAVAGMFTPQLTGDAITGEKERRTLPFLLLTDLTSREIILGKLASRLLQIGLLLLAGLPVLVALQFFGGIEPAFVFFGTIALAATVWSVGSLSMLCSVYARTPRAAGQRTGQVLAGYIFGMILSGTMFRFWPWLGGWPAGSRFTLSDLRDWLNIGNPIWAFEAIGRAASARSGATIVETLVQFSLFHAICGLIFVVWAIVRLRPVAAILPADGPPPAKRGERIRDKPPVGNRPVAWKMVFCDFRPYKSGIGRLTARLAYVFSFAPVLIVLGFALSSGALRAVPDSMEFYNRVIGTMMLCGLLVHVAAQASSSIGRERHKQTLDELLLTDLSIDDILRQKWWGSVLTMRWMLLWVLFQWGIAVTTRGMHPLAIPLIAILWAIYVAFAASLGMYYSARLPTMQKSALWTTLMGFIVVVLPVALALILLWQREDSPWYAACLTMSPPAALGVGAFTARNLELLGRSPSAAVAVAMAVGIGASALVYSVLALLFWRGARYWLPRTVSRG